MYCFAKLVSPIASARLGVDRNLFGICLRSVLALVVVYAVMCLLYLPKAIQAVRRLMRLEEPQLGPFMGDGAPEARGAHLG